MSERTPADPSGTSGSAAFSVERRQVALRRINRGGIRWRLLRDWAESFVIAVAIWLVLKAFFVEAYRIPSGSMERTLLVGDRLLVNKLAYGADLPFTGHRLPGFEHPQRGDIIVFRWPVDPHINFIKRVVGVPGDTLAMRDGTLFLNGKSQSRAICSARPAAADDPAEPEFSWQRAYLVRGRRPAKRTIHRETTGGRWSSLSRAISCSATTATTRTTAAIGASCRRC